MKGLVLTHMEKREEGLELVRKGVRLDLTSHICWHVFGLIQKSEKNYEEALKSYTQALRFDKASRRALRSQLPPHDRIMKCAPEDWSCSQLQGSQFCVCGSSNSYVSRGLCSETNSRLSQENMNILRDFAHLQTQLRQYDGLVETRHTLLRLRPNVRANWVGLAVAYHLNNSLSETKKVLEHYESMLKVCSANLDVRTAPQACA